MRAAYSMSPACLAEQPRCAALSKRCAGDWALIREDAQIGTFGGIEVAGTGMTGGEEEVKELRMDAPGPEAGWPVHPCRRHPGHGRQRLRVT